MASRRATGVALGAIAIVLALGAIGLRSAASGTTALTLPKAPPSGVAGVLFQDLDGDGEFDAGERPLEGRSIRIYGTGPSPIATATSSADGTFVVNEVPSLADGTRVVRASLTPIMEGPATSSLPADTALSQSVDIALGESVEIAVHSFRACLDIEACPEINLPDLTPVVADLGATEYPPPTETVVDTSTQPGRTLLRFATSTANIGGLLHLVGSDEIGSADTREVVQRVYGPGLEFDHKAGEFTYHPEHHHIHVDNFVRYELLSADASEVIRSSEKVSFCLTDVIRFDTVTNDKTGISLELPPFECGSVEQGINPGYADYYGSELPDQWIDVTGLTSGTYVLRFTVNPDRALLESTYDNNVVSFPVTYVAP